ncbi:RNA-directed DNA polymerase, eukaryota [Tanacetum coccineum]
MDLLLKNIDIVFKQSKFTTSKDGYVIEGKLKEYEDSSEKSKIQVFFGEKFNQYHLRIEEIVRIKIIHKLEALPTRFNISRRGIEIDSILCPICDRGVESTRHIFFSCCLVRQIARKICSWWDIEYSDVNSFTEWINWMASLRLQSKVKMMIQGVFFVVWWLVWSYRNKLLFEEKKPSKAIIFDDVVSISFYWCKSRCKASFSWDDWLKNPSLISL